MKIISFVALVSQPFSPLFFLFFSCFFFLLLRTLIDEDCKRRWQNSFLNDFPLTLICMSILVNVPCFRCRASNNSIRNNVIVETEIAGLRGAVGQYNVIQTLPYKSVAPMHESAYVVECPPQLGKLTSIRITIWQGSLEVNTSTDLVLIYSVLFHADRFH